MYSTRGDIDNDSMRKKRFIKYENGLLQSLIWMKFVQFFIFKVPCSGGKIYSASASACPATCANPSPAVCGIKAACQCPAGMVENNGVCLKPNDCVCTDSYGARRTVNKCYTSFLHVRRILFSKLLNRFGDEYIEVKA